MAENCLRSESASLNWWNWVDRILTNNVIDRLKNLLLTHLHHPNIHIHTMH